LEKPDEHSIALTVNSTIEHIVWIASYKSSLGEPYIRVRAAAGIFYFTGICRIDRRLDLFFASTKNSVRPRAFDAGVEFD